MQTDGTGGESNGKERCKQVVQRGRAMEKESVKGGSRNSGNSGKRWERVEDSERRRQVNGRLTIMIRVRGGEGNVLDELDDRGGYAGRR